MKERTTFVINFDWLPFFKRLDGDDVKELVIAMYACAKGDVADESEMSDKLLLIWDFIKPKLEKYKEDYDEVCKINSENSRKRSKTKKTTDNDRLPNATNSTDSDNDNDNDCDIDIDNDIDCENDNDIDIVCVSENNTHAHTEKNSYGKYSNVFLTPEEHDEYKKSYSQTDEVIEELSAAIKAYPNKYSGDSRALLDRFIAVHKRNNENSTSKLQSYQPKKASTASYDIEEALRRSRMLDPTQTKRQQRTAAS